MSEEPRKRKIPVRWVTLGEGVALAAVAISGLGLYNSWQTRNETPVQSASGKPAAARPLTLRAGVEEEGRQLTLSPADDGQVIQSQTIAFPKALAVAPVETTGNPRIEAGWIDSALAKAAGDGKTAGDRRVPVLVTTRWIEDGADRTETSIYQLGYALTEGGLFGGRHVRLRGLSLSARGAKDGQARVDGWRGG